MLDEIIFISIKLIRRKYTITDGLVLLDLILELLYVDPVNDP